MSNLIRNRSEETPVHAHHWGKSKIPGLPHSERRRSRRFSFAGSAVAAWSGGLARIQDASSGGAKFHGASPMAGQAVVMALKLPFQAPLLLRSRPLHRPSNSSHPLSWSGEFLGSIELDERLAVSSLLASCLRTTASKTLVLSPPGSVLQGFVSRLRKDGHNVEHVTSPLETLWLLKSDANYDTLIAHEESMSCEILELSETLADEFPTLGTKYWTSSFDGVLSTFRESMAVDPSRWKSKSAYVINDGRMERVKCLSCGNQCAGESSNVPLFCPECVERSRQRSLSEFYDDIGVAG